MKDKTLKYFKTKYLYNDLGECELKSEIDSIISTLDDSHIYHVRSYLHTQEVEDLRGHIAGIKKYTNPKNAVEDLYYTHHSYEALKLLEDAIVIYNCCN